MIFSIIIYRDLVLLALCLLNDLQRLGASLLIYCRARDFLQKIESIFVLHHTNIRHLALLHYIIGIRLGKARRL